jgi:hypothetical protein
MTRQEAKNELKQIKKISLKVKDVDLEIERLMAIATRMTPSYDGIASGSYTNRIEEAVIKIEDYRIKLSNLLVDELSQRDKCLKKVNQIQPASLRSVLLYYYFMDNTMEKTAEMLNKSYQWTYTMFQTAIDEYCKISEKN